MSDRPRKAIAEPRLVMLALVAVAVMMLCILAIFDTDDVWIVAATVVAIGLIAFTIAVDVWRVLATSEESDTPDESSSERDDPVVRAP